LIAQTLPDYLVPETGLEDKRPIVLEIGFGGGENLLANLLRFPDHLHIGVEIYQRGLAQMIDQAVAAGVEGRLKLYQGAAQDLLPLLPKGQLHRVSILFADPWPKARHHKRRIVQTPFMQAIGSALAPGGLLILATDWEEYAQHMLEVLDEVALLENQAGRGQFWGNHYDDRIETRFERKGKRAGREIFDLRYKRSTTVS